MMSAKVSIYSLYMVTCQLSIVKMQASSVNFNFLIAFCLVIEINQYVAKIWDLDGWTDIYLNFYSTIIILYCVFFRIVKQNYMLLIH